MVGVQSQSLTSNYALCIASIVKQLIHSYENNEQLNFTKLKSKASEKYKIKGIPKITDVIAAIPASHRKQLLPYLRAKPVRTASGVAVVAVMSKVSDAFFCFRLMNH